MMSINCSSAHGLQSSHAVQSGEPACRSWPCESFMGASLQAKFAVCSRPCSPAMLLHTRKLARSGCQKQVFKVTMALHKWARTACSARR